MTELNIQEDQSLFTTDPEILIFKLDTENLLELSSNKSKISKELDLKVKNGYNEYLSFRIKTIKKFNFIITPSYCIIMPKEEKLIKVRFKRDEGEELKLKSYKIQLEGFIISKDDKDINAKELFDKYKKSGEKVIGKIKQIRCKFLDKYDNNISSLSCLNPEIQNNEKSIFVSAISKDLSMNEIDKKNKNQHKDEKNPLLINPNIPINKNMNDIKEEQNKENEINEENNENNSGINKIEDTSKINSSNHESSSENNRNIEEENKQNKMLNETIKNEIKREKIDLLSNLSNKQIIIGIIIIIFIIGFIIYFTI